MSDSNAPRWTTAADVRVRWLSGPLSVEDEQIDILLSDVEDFLAGEFPDLTARLADGRLPAARLKRVVVRIAIRVLRNPSGYRQVTSGTGPFTGSATYGGDHPGEIYISPADRAALGGREKSSTRRAGSGYIA